MNQKEFNELLKEMLIRISATVGVLEEALLEHNIISAPTSQDQVDDFLERHGF